MIIEASFLWRANEPDGVGLVFTKELMPPESMTAVFDGKISKAYFRRSDDLLGKCVVKQYLSQLAELADAHKTGRPIPMPLVILGALNIAWLSSRGFIPKDNFNGPQYVHQPKDST